MARTKGGEFIVRNAYDAKQFTPEQWTEEQLLIAATCSDFISNNITPNLDKIDYQEPGLMESLLEKAGELGLLGLSLSEKYFGMGVDSKTSLLATEVLGKGYSFSVAFGAHTGIGTLPLYYYGTDAQREKYLPKLASGEWKAAYCLTEPSSGSDANSGKSRATLSADGTHYILNGQKMWITNGGFAHLYTVFAKIDGDDNLSAFLVEAHSEGISKNPEEHKMGIKGSSTRQLFFNDVKVPVDHLLGERNGGFKIALNILNIGRIKLAAGVLGGAKDAQRMGVKYAAERMQFGKTLDNYGAIRGKIGEQTLRIFALESALYRCAHDVDEAIEAYTEKGLTHEEATLKGIEEFAAECALLKVAGSECLDYVVDESLQIHGGMGYSSESLIERAYRDSRINRIFEGTNEINRMLFVDMILRKAFKGKLDLMGPAQAVVQELMSIPSFQTETLNEIDSLKAQLVNHKKVLLLIAGAAVQKFQLELSKQQALLMSITDIAIRIYEGESMLRRTEQLVDFTSANNKTALEMTQLYIYDSGDVLLKIAKDCATQLAEGDELRMMMLGIKRFTKQLTGVQPHVYRDSIAQARIDQKENWLSFK